MLIEVTSNHIKQGKPKDCFNCPVALAFNEAFPKFEHQVFPTGMRLRHKDEADWIVTAFPDHIIERITTFDNTGLMEPFNISVQPMSDVILENTEAGTWTR